MSTSRGSVPLSCRMRQCATVVLLALGLVLPGMKAQVQLLQDGSFEEFGPEAHGAWEFRYGHKGGDYPKARPT